MAPAIDIGGEQVDMDVVVVEAVAARAEHRVKLFAGSGENLLQERSFPSRATPPGVDHDDVLAVRQAKAGDVQRIAEGMLRDLPEIVAVAAAAAIGGDLLDLDHAAAEVASGRRLHRSLNPAVQRRREGAADGRWRGDADADAQQAR